MMVIILSFVGAMSIFLLLPQELPFIQRNMEFILTVGQYLCATFIVLNILVLGIYLLFCRD